VPQPGDQRYSHEKTGPRRDQRGDVVVPIVEEEAKVRTREREGDTVRISRKDASHEETLRIPITHEEVDVQRVKVGARVDGPIEPWRDGETLVIPVMEQVPVVTMQWVVREEIRVTRHARREEREQTVRLRRQEAVVERNPAGTTGRNHEGGTR
jgi:stress response protein YsnF